MNREEKRELITRRQVVDYYCREPECRDGLVYLQWDDDLQEYVRRCDSCRTIEAE